MLEIKIDLIPFGVEKFRKTLGTVKIINTGGGRPTGNYRYILEDVASNDITEGKLKGFQRLKYNAFHLLRDVLNKAFPPD